MSRDDQLRIVFYNSFSKDRFELNQGTRPWYILMILAEGSFECRMDGQRFTVGAGEIVCFPSNTFFERKVVEPVRFHQVGFLLPREDPCAALLPAGKLELPKERAEELIAALDRAARYRPEEGKRLYAYAVSHLLMENYIHCAKNDPPAAQMDGDITLAVQYLTDHLAEKIRMEELAQLLHLSYTGFLWKFQRAMQCTPSEFLIRIRMQYAKQLLLDGDLRINEIARLCGYNNAYYFSSAFHKACGMAPGAYRKSKMQI